MFLKPFCRLWRWPRLRQHRFPRCCRRRRRRRLRLFKPRRLGLFSFRTERSFYFIKPVESPSSYNIPDPEKDTQKTENPDVNVRLLQSPSCQYSLLVKSSICSFVANRICMQVFKLRSRPAKFDVGKSDKKVKIAFERRVAGQLRGEDANCQERLFCPALRLGSKNTAFLIRYASLMTR